MAKLKLAFPAVITALAIAVSVAARAQDDEWESAQQLEVPPAGADVFQLDDPASFKKFSRVKNFEIVGHSYLRGPWINPAFAHVGMAINTMRICDQVAYLAGYESNRLRRADCGR